MGIKLKWWNAELYVHSRLGVIININSLKIEKQKKSRETRFKVKQKFTALGTTDQWIALLWDTTRSISPQNYINYLHLPYIPTACTLVILRIGQVAPKGGCRTSSEIHDLLWSFIVVDNNMYKCIYVQVFSPKPWTVQVCCYIRLWEGNKPGPKTHKQLSACQFSGRHGESEALLSMIRYDVPLAMSSATDM